MLRAQNEGGKATVGDSSLTVANADAVTLLVACGTNYVNWKDLSADPQSRARHDLDGAAGKTYDQLRTQHLQDYQALFRRVTIDLGTIPSSALPTDERVKQFARGQDPQLAGLFFQYGRYLLISCSRPGGQPGGPRRRIRAG